MQIHPDILVAYGGFKKRYPKGSFIFNEGDSPHFYYQVVDGLVKVYSTNTEGKDLIQGMFKAGESFGEPPLFVNKPYPSTAQASSDCIVIKITKEKLLSLLNDYPEMVKSLLFTFADRIYAKSTSAQIYLGHTPEEKILMFFDRIKSQDNGTTQMLIPYTRQQIADFTGIRVETVIRTLVEMCKKQKVSIVNRRVYY